ncbi:MAG: ATP-binding cassette domain-containing protein, partial [Oscillospiraceae bacterium]|nr:ATP-binding cassette domain-containing protein [Oscillospiraceae bacterium]
MIVEDLNKQFGEGDTAVKALDHVSFTLDSGVFAAVTGESGSGKTTLLNVIGSLLQPDSGSVRIDGYDITKQGDDALAVYRRRKIGFIFQNYNLIPVLTVEENIIFPLQNLKGKQKMTKEAMHLKAVEVAKLVQIDQLMERKPKELS